VFFKLYPRVCRRRDILNGCACYASFVPYRHRRTITLHPNTAIARYHYRHHHWTRRRRHYRPHLRTTNVALNQRVEQGRLWPCEHGHQRGGNDEGRKLKNHYNTSMKRSLVEPNCISFCFLLVLLKRPSFRYPNIQIIQGLNFRVQIPKGKQPARSFALPLPYSSLSLPYLSG